MSSVRFLREFVNERLTAAAEEIIGVFETAIVEYEEEIDRQRRLLDVIWKPEIKLRRIELPQQHVCPEEGGGEVEVLPDQQLCDQEMNTSLHHRDPEPPQIKEEQEEEKLELKQENHVLTPTHEDHSDHQLLSHNSPVAESQDHTESEDGDLGSPGDAEPQPNDEHHKGDSNNVYNPTMSHIQSSAHTGNESFKCDTCGKTFEFNSKLQRHLSIHTGEKPYLCKTCGKRFGHLSVLKTHIRVHTGERPYSCKTCGKDFTRSSALNVHMRLHTGEMPYLCKTCGKSFRAIPALKRHVSIHTGEKPFTCKTCEKSFCWSSELKAHERIHTGERPYSCKVCGKDFRLSSILRVHTRTHTGEKPYLCKTCGRVFRSGSGLLVHIRRAHTGERPYRCNTCGKAFCDVSGLKSHVKGHTRK